MAYPPDNYPLTSAGVEDYPVKVGSMLLTLVDPHKGFESAYNRWYERDHFYAGCMEGPWQIAGSRWVATREMKDLRWGDTSVTDPIDAGSYVAIYWVEEGHHKDWDDWALPQVGQLYADGRGFTERSHVHTATFDNLGALYRDADPVPVELALDHHYDAIVCVWLDARNGLDAAALKERITHSDALHALFAGSDIEIVSSWTPRPEFRNSRDGAPMSLGSPGGQENRLTQVCFVGGDVRASMDWFKAYAKALEELDLADVKLVAPFLRTVVGTDTYVDQLW